MEFLSLIVSYPELIGTPEAGRAGDLLIDPASRQLFRALRESISAGHHLDISAWLESAPADTRRTISMALMDEGMSKADNPPAKLRALSSRLELQRIEAEISMTRQLLKQARSRGDSSEAAAIMKRGIELDQTKQGLKAALQRP